MTLSSKLRNSVFQIISFGIIWGVSGIVYSVLEKGLLGDLTYYPATGNPYDFKDILLATVFSAALIGLGSGALEALYFRKLFSNMGLARKIACKTLLYLVIIFLGLLFITILRAGSLDARTLQSVWIFFSGYAAWSIAAYMAATILVSLFYIEVSQNLGQAVLLNFISGRYHTPREEERIFMFLDMKSSTTIAEKIGHIKYFDMLRMYFADLSDPILEHKGEIYQYVGDEIVISWRLQNGVQDNYCVQCFYAMKAALENQRDTYIATFGLVPTFKAGLHFGKVTTGEIGVIKKDIIFTGDVLNTTARIQSLCNEQHVDLLISAPLLNRLTLPDQFKIRALGECTLRGRDEKISLYTIQSA